MYKNNFIFFKKSINNKVFFSVNYRSVSSFTERELRRVRILNQSRNFVKDRNLSVANNNEAFSTNYIIYASTGALSPVQRSRLRSNQSIFSDRKFNNKIQFVLSSVSLSKKISVLSKFNAFASLLQGSNIQRKFAFNTNENQEQLRKSFFDKINTTRQTGDINFNLDFTPIRIFFPTTNGSQLYLRQNEACNKYISVNSTIKTYQLPRYSIYNILTSLRISQITFLFKINFILQQIK